MALLSEMGSHVELNVVDSEKNTKPIFPSNTSDDVYIDENGNVLSDALSLIMTTSGEVSGALNLEEFNDIVLTDDTLINLLTTSIEESFDDITELSTET